jgi:hypothetical protein
LSEYVSAVAWSAASFGSVSATLPGVPVLIGRMSTM